MQRTHRVEVVDGADYLARLVGHEEHPQCLPRPVCQLAQFDQIACGSHAVRLTARARRYGMQRRCVSVSASARPGWPGPRDRTRATGRVWGARQSTSLRCMEEEEGDAEAEGDEQDKQLDLPVHQAVDRVALPGKWGRNMSLPMSTFASSLARYRCGSRRSTDPIVYSYRVSTLQHVQK